MVSVLGLGYLKDATAFGIATSKTCNSFRLMLLLCPVCSLGRMNS